MTVNLKTAFLLTALLISFSFVNAQNKTNSEKVTSKVKNEQREKFDPQRDPAKDLREAIAKAKKSNKRIILDVGGEWCIWCHRLDQFFSDNKDVNEFLHKNYIVVKVNFSPENKNEKFLAQFPKVAGYPHLFVLEKDGKLLHSQNTGDLEAGKGHDHDKVLGFLKKWAPAKNS